MIFADPFSHFLTKIAKNMLSEMLQLTSRLLELQSMNRRESNP